MVDFMNKRGNWLEGQEVYTVLPPTISEVGVEGRERFSSVMIKEFRVHAKVEGYPKNVYIGYRFNESDRFTIAAMSNDGKTYDKKAGDDIYGVVIQPMEGKDKVQYFIMAENAKTVGYSPSNYNFTQYTASLSEINQ
ncbi:MAG: hypothetical protein R2795_07425 [Saprospiraceae bacterium]